MGLTPVFTRAGEVTIIGTEKHFGQSKRRNGDLTARPVIPALTIMDLISVSYQSVTKGPTDPRMNPPQGT